MNNYEEVDEIEFVDHDMEFSSILDIPLYAQIRSSLHAYFAKIHATISVPSIIGNIFFVILSIQSLFPSFLIDCQELWPTNNFLTSILQIFSTLWVGPPTNKNYVCVAVSLALSFIFIFSFIFLILRSLKYKKRMRLDSVEIWTSYIIFKYIYPLACPHLINNLPLVIQNFVQHRYIAISVIDVIISPIATAVFLVLVYTVIFPRVLFENLPTHEWLPALPLAYISNTIFQALLSVLVSVFGNRKAKICIPIIMSLLSTLCGFVVYFFSSVLKRSICVVVGSIAFTSAFVSLIQGVNLIITNHIKPEIIFILFIAFFVIIYIGLRLLDTKLTIEVLSFFDSCEESPQTAKELMNQKIKNSHIFIAYVRFTLSQCHPFISSMEAFTYALHRWPDDSNLILFYGRILAIFPWRNNQMAYVASLLSKQTGSRSYTSFLLQFRHISRTRQTLLTPRIKHQIEEIQMQCDTLKRIIRRFWENILQKNTNAFWDDVFKVNKRMRDIENILQKMCDDYPNNEAVLLEQIKFVSTIKKDYIEEDAIKARLQKLRTEGFIKGDTSFTIASKVFPIFCTQAEVYETTDNVNDKIDTDDNRMLQNSFDNELSDNDSSSISDRNCRICVQQSTARSQLGRVWIIILFLAITTCLCIALYVVYHLTYVSKFLGNELNSIDFLTTLNKAIYEINSMCFYLTVFPSSFPGYKCSLPPDFMEQVAPSLYPNHVPFFNFTADFISRHSSAAGEYMSLISSTLIKLDEDDEYVKAVNEILTINELENLLTVKSTLNQMLLDSKSILLYTDPKSYYESDEYLRLGINYMLLFGAFTNMSTIATHYASTVSGKNTDFLNNLMVLLIVVNLLFVSLPFVLILFKLQLQSDSIAVSFSYLPNTEIRSIINEFGSGTTKNDEDTNSISRLTQLIPLRSSENLKKIIIFCFTFLPIFVCSLATYYYSFDFVDKTQKIAMKIFTLYPAFAEMKSGIGFLIRVAQMDTDPDNFLPETENRDYVLMQSSILLYLSIASFSEGMWGEIAGADAYFNPRFASDVEIDTFSDIFNPSVTNKVPHSFTYFEQFAIEGLLRSIDVIFGYSLSYLTEHLNKSSPCNFSDNLILSLFYWFGSFNYINRTLIYFNLVEKYVDMDINDYYSNEVAIMSVSIAAQIFAYLLVVLYLLERHFSIRASLRFYHYISPQVLLENQNIVMLIENEKRTMEKANTSFLNVEYTVEMDPKGIVILDQNLVIIKNNPAFFHIVTQQNQNEENENVNQNENQENSNNDQNQEHKEGEVQNLKLYLNPIKNQINDVFKNFVKTLNDQSLKGQSLPDLITNVESSSDTSLALLNENIENFDRPIKKSNSKSENDSILEGSWTDFIFHLNECISGKFKPRFTMNISGKTFDGRLVHLSCTVIAMNSEGAVEEGGVSKVEKLAIIFEDCTHFYVRKQMINQEQSLAHDLLLQILPDKLANSFMETDYEGFSFVVQTATIGCLDVHFGKESDNVSQEKLQLASDLLKIFDEEIEDFDLLCKVRSFGTTYVFAGGLISDLNKPERHAEQAAKFALKMINLVEDLSKKTEYDIKLSVGIHTGGPVVAGVIENQKPMLQVIGSVMEIASQMTITDVPMQVQVTRAVYELIFTAGFHIIERGDTEIRGGQTMTTYLINPK